MFSSRVSRRGEGSHRQQDGKAGMSVICWAFCKEGSKNYDSNRKGRRPDKGNKGLNVQNSESHVPPAGNWGKTIVTKLAGGADVRIG